MDIKIGGDIPMIPLPRIILYVIGQSSPQGSTCRIASPHRRVFGEDNPTKTFVPPSINSFNKLGVFALFTLTKECF